MTDAELILAFQEILPEAILCIEWRPLGETKLISAAVLLDLPAKAAVVIANVDFLWMGDLRVNKVFVQPVYTRERPRIPLHVYRNGRLDQMNHESAVRIVLQTSPDTATYVAFPWHMDYLDELAAVEKWVFWSLLNEQSHAKSHYFGFGHFASHEDFDRYIDTVCLRFAGRKS